MAAYCRDSPELDTMLVYIPKKQGKVHKYIESPGIKQMNANLLVVLEAWCALIMKLVSVGHCMNMSE